MLLFLPFLPWFLNLLLLKTLFVVTQLVHEATHTNVHNHPQRQEHEQNGRPAITHQWQGYSGDRHKANHHADIDQDMEAKHSHHTHHHERVSAVGRCLRVLGQTHQHYEV